MRTKRLLLLLVIQHPAHTFAWPQPLWACVPPTITMLYRMLLLLLV